jgi:hypothetical protein
VAAAVATLCTRVAAVPAAPTIVRWVRATKLFLRLAIFSSGTIPATTAGCTPSSIAKVAFR